MPRRDRNRKTILEIEREREVEAGRAPLFCLLPLIGDWQARGRETNEAPVKGGASTARGGSNSIGRSRTGVGDSGFDRCVSSLASLTSVNDTCRLFMVRRIMWVACSYFRSYDKDLGTIFHNINFNGV